MTGLVRKPFARREGSLLLRAESPAPEGKTYLRIVVSKKVSRLAVQRNRIRRVLREAVRKELGARQEQNLVLVVLPGIDLKSAAASVRRLLQPRKSTH